jgi:phytoene synthase
MPAAVPPVLAHNSVAESYRYCREIARKRAKNFYYSFLLLEKPQRDAMCAVYAFMRHCDDLSDEPAEADKRRLGARIAQWRAELDRALSGSTADSPIWPAFRDTVERYCIPRRFFYEMIEGVASDIEPREIRNFDELYAYCYKVASVVGLVIIHIFGFDNPAALLLAEKSGIAFQLTNILRDVREDAALGRVYLPAEDLHRFGVTAEQLRAGTEDERFCELMRFEARRARAFYQQSEPLMQMIHPGSRRSLWALRQIYQRLLDRIEHANYRVLSRRINVPLYVKVGLLARAFWR